MDDEDYKLISTGELRPIVEYQIRQENFPGGLFDWWIEGGANESISYFDSAEEAEQDLRKEYGF